MDNAELLKRLLATFRVEAEERVHAMSLALLALEQRQTSEQQSEIVEGIFREAHSLKGAARAVNLSRVESLCQALESVLAALKRGKIWVTDALLELLHHSTDALGEMLDPEAEAAAQIDDLLAKLEGASAGRVPTRRPGGAAPASTENGGEPISAVQQPPQQPQPEPQPPNQPLDAQRPPPSSHSPAPATSAKGTQAPGAASRGTPATVRVSVDKLEALMRQVESLLGPSQAAAQLAIELREATGEVTNWRKRWSKFQPELHHAERRFGGAARELQSLLEYLDGEQEQLKTLEDRLSLLTGAAERDHRQLSAAFTALLGDAKELQMMPFSSLLEMFPKLVRELGREQGKEAQLLIDGGELGIDRRLLEAMKDPLTHLLRNAIGHGIESPDARRERGKPARGTISIQILQRDSNKIEMLVSDDGAGVDVAGLRSAATGLGLVDPSEAAVMAEDRLRDLSFHSGVSTSPSVTDLSGRGLGLTIVREQIELLGGSVELTSEPESGTSFRIILPLTLATFHGLLVRASGRLYVLPASGVERALRLSGDDVNRVENRETVTVDDRTLPLVALDSTLGLPPSSQGGQDERLQAVVVAGSSRVAFRVDEIVGEQEVLMKPLGPQLARVPNVVGATVLASGEVVPVLNVADLLTSATHNRPAPGPSPAPPEGEKASKSILVAEDSITSRSLLKGILESAGYRVATAVDGLDAFTTLKTGSFDLLVSDVDMPRMDGLDLTGKVRADGRLSELPVVLVTSLSSIEDRERGVEVGANAYIVKSGFDQSSLLDAVRRLIG